MPVPVIPLVAGAAALFQSFLGGRQSRKNVRDTNRANRELAEYQYQQERKQMRELLEYNTPLNQMKRYEQAGLNPNLIYSQGNPGNQATIPKYEAPEQSYHERTVPINIAQTISQYQDFELKQAQINNVEAVAAQNQINAAIAGATRSSKEHQINLKLGLMRQEHQKNISEIEIRRLMEKRLQKELTAKDYDNIYKKYRNEWMSQGITSSDNIAFRMLVRMLMSTGVNLMDNLKR